ncbi:MAG TPA: citrate/2-methylcitrate synthase [Streptosporangiaceae bacterium]|nr:citrate/2-methylcitrate synthase [Streptosporangiaceae bacterium]
MTEWIGAAEAAERLGIKQASLYAYVSRGVLSRRREPDGRASMFDAGEVDELARRGRPRRQGGRTGPAELVIESALTEITPSTQRYRGYEATELAVRCSFEDVALLLWTGSLPGHGIPGPEPASEDAADTAVADAATGWTAMPAAIEAGRAAQAALPTGTLPLERIQVIVPALAATDQFRLHLDRPAVVAAGKALIYGITDALPPAAAAAAASDASAPGSVADRLATRLCPAPASPGLIRVINAALILVADHELAASTLAARVAASMRADPYAVVSTGLGAMTGALHGGAALGAEIMLGSAGTPADAPRVVGDVLRRGEKLPGFGHFVYRDGDPRANLLMRLIAEHAPDSERLAVALAVTAEARRRALPDPNIEFALAVLAAVAGMIRGAGEAMFATGRTAGWLAHALEEYERDIPIRPRCVYTGPRER